MNNQFDILLACLREAAEYSGIPFNQQAVLARLPLTEDGLSPELLLQTAERAGFNANLEKSQLNTVPHSDSTGIALLLNNQAVFCCPDTEKGTVRYLKPTPDGEVNEIPEVEVSRHYSGFRISLMPRTATTTTTLETDINKRTNPAESHWFWGTLWRYRQLYIQLLPASVLVNLFALVMPFFVMIVYDRVVPNNAVETLWVLAGGVTLVFIFDLTIRLVRGALLEKAGKDMDIELAGTLYAQLLSLSMRALPASTGNLTSRIRSYETLREFFVSATMLAIADMPFALLMIGAIFYLGGPIGWVLVCASLLAIAVSVWIQFPLYKAVRSSAEVGLERQAFISESIANLEPIKLNNAEGYFQSRMNRLLRHASASSTRSHWYGLLANSMTTTIVNLTSVVVVVTGVYQVSNGSLSMGGLIACVMLSSRCMAPMTMLSGLMTRFQQALQSLESLTGVMSLEKETNDHKQYLQSNNTKPGFQFNNATLTYKDNAVPALRDINLSIGEGEKVALLGRIGSGKSTLLKIMAGLQTTSGGNVLVDDFDLTQYHPSALRSLIGYVPQEAALFHGNLRDNVTLGNHKISDTQILEALGGVGLGDFIRNHPQGLQAEVGERGVLLSGGQRRAITLARCLVKDSPLLLLDEPTANLDPQTERMFINTLKSHSKNKTLVVATHKTSVLELVDRVIVLDQGKVVSDEPVTKILKHLQGIHSNDDTAKEKPSGNKASVTVNRKSSYTLAGDTA